jgi:hypothetical protein
MSLEIVSLAQTAILNASCKLCTSILINFLLAYDATLNGTWLLTLKSVGVSYRVKLNRSVNLLCSVAINFAPLGPQGWVQQSLLKRRQLTTDLHGVIQENAGIVNDPQCFPILLQVVLLQTSCKKGTGSFPGVESGRGITLTPHSLLMPRSKNRVKLYLYSP